MTDPVIDEAAFANLVAMTGEDFIGELVAAYVEEAPPLLAEMERALAAGQAEDFARAAHSLKSSSASLGALGFSEQARQMEGLGRSGDLAGAGERMELFVAEYARVERALKERTNES
jgi:HPt (histidine-containing phosphotransfer) domain-containing protein